jgi:hypothetical protein
MCSSQTLSFLIVKYAGREMRTRKAVITIRLVKESEELSNKEIEKELLKELGDLKIAWMDKVEKVAILESGEN